MKRLILLALITSLTFCAYTPPLPYRNPCTAREIVEGSKLIRGIEAVSWWELQRHAKKLKIEGPVYGFLVPPGKHLPAWTVYLDKDLSMIGNYNVYNEEACHRWRIEKLIKEGYGYPEARSREANHVDWTLTRL